jgi:predicted aconitase with swiveling domain
MEMLKGRVMLGGRGAGPALVTRMPMNFTAAFTKPVNLLPSRRAEIQDRHHELYRKNIEGSVLVFPACIGSTFTGMVLMQLMIEGHGPAAVVVQNADPLLVSGAVLAEVWFKKGVPVIEYRGADLFDRVRTGERVEVDGGSGEIRVGAG